MLIVNSHNSFADSLRIAKIRAGYSMRNGALSFQIPNVGVKKDLSLFANEKIPMGDIKEPMGNAATPLGDIRKPMGNTAIPLGNARKPMGDMKIPMGKMKNPLGDTRKPLGETKKHLGKMKEPLGDIKKPLGKMKKPMGEMVNHRCLRAILVFLSILLKINDAHCCHFLSDACADEIYA